MKFVDINCPHCGAKLNIDAEKKQATCQYCGTSLMIDDEVQRVQYDNAEEAGYNFEKGRQRAQAENTVRQDVPTVVQEPMSHKRKTWLWVLGWIFIFPIPLTILILRNEKFSKGLKIGIIAVSWVVYLLIGISGGAVTEEDSELNGAVQTTESSTLNNAEQTDTQTENALKESSIDVFVNKYNETADNKLVFDEDFVVSDPQSGHYRTEFRLTAFKDAVGKSYKLGDLTVDIISREGTLGKSTIRIYSDGATLDQCIELIKTASPILDPTMDADTLSNAITYVSQEKKANGYYYGKLGLLLLGDDEKGYDLMIKTD